MNLKTVRLPDGSSGPTILCLKQPKFFVAEVSVGEIFEVPDEIGHALIAKHPGMFTEALKPISQPVDSSQVKMTRKVSFPQKNA